MAHAKAQPEAQVCPPRQCSGKGCAPEEFFCGGRTVARYHLEATVELQRFFGALALIPTWCAGADPSARHRELERSWRICGRFRRHLKNRPLSKHRSHKADIFIVRVASRPYGALQGHAVGTQTDILREFQRHRVRERNSPAAAGVLLNVSPEDGMIVVMHDAPVAHAHVSHDLPACPSLADLTPKAPNFQRAHY